jgi:hypothetical protein
MNKKSFGLAILGSILFAAWILSRPRLRKMKSFKRKRRELGSGYPNWEIEEGVSPDGSVSNKYFFRGELALRVPLDSHLARQAAGYALIEKDLRNIAWCIQKIQALQKEALGDIFEPLEPVIMPGSRDDANLLKLLLISALSLYGKLFTTAGGRRTSLARDHVDPDLREKHDFLMELRHNFAAHSGEVKHEEAELVLLLDPDDARHEGCVISTELKQPNALDQAGLDSFLKIVTGLRKRAIAKRQELSNKIMSEEVVPLGPEHWHAVAKKANEQREA